MDEERERGRIVGLETRRRQAAEWASTFIPLLEEARLILGEWRDTGKPSQNAYAGWLNNKGIPTRRDGGRWTSQTVERLINIHIGLIEHAEEEFERLLAIIRFKWKLADSEAKQALADEEHAVREARARAINDAYRLSAKLRGKHYVDQAIPPRLGKVTRRARKKDDPQLSLFDGISGGTKRRS